MLTKPNSLCIHENDMMMCHPWRHVPCCDDVTFIVVSAIRPYHNLYAVL